MRNDEMRNRLPNTKKEKSLEAVQSPPASAAVYYSLLPVCSRAR